MQANYVQRLRVKFSKQGPTRWIGHLDLARTWERALNRSAIPMAYTQGFNRRPRMQFASALPLGYISSCEYIDLWLAEHIEPQQALDQLRGRMAPGIDVQSVTEVDLREPALPTQTVSAVYHAHLNHVDVDVDSLQRKIADFLAAEEVIAEKQSRKNKGKRYNLRPLVDDIQLVDGEPVTLALYVSAAEGRAARPNQILLALGIDAHDTTIERTELLLTAGE